MFRANRITPPSPNSRTSDLSSTGSCSPLKPAISNCPIRRRSGRLDMHSNYNSAVSIVASAPTRIDLAGGTIDIWPLYLFHDGASTLNAAISLRAHAHIEPRTDGRVELRSVATHRRIGAGRWVGW